MCYCTEINTFHYSYNYIVTCITKVLLLSACRLDYPVSSSKTRTFWVNCFKVYFCIYPLIAKTPENILKGLKSPFVDKIESDATNRREADGVESEHY